MSKEFFIGERRFIINEDKNDVRIYLEDKYGNPAIELALTPYNDVFNKDYISYDVEESFINLVNNINKKIPIEKISISENLIITKNHELYLLLKKDNLFSIYPVSVKIIDNNYNALLNKLLAGRSIKVGHYILSSDTFYKIVNNEINIENINDTNTRSIINKLVDMYKIINVNDIKNTAGEGTGTGSETAKIKVRRRAGYANKILIICLSFFTIGVIVALLIVIINKFVF